MKVMQTEVDKYSRRVQTCRSEDAGENPSSHRQYLQHVACFTLGWMLVTSLSLLRPTAGMAQVSGFQSYVVILLRFSDIQDTPECPGEFADDCPGYFRAMLQNEYPGLDHYWRECSYDQINLTGSIVVDRWYDLPQPRSYYVYDMDGDGVEDTDDLEQLLVDGTAVADDDVYFPDFDGIIMVFNTEPGATLVTNHGRHNRELSIDGETRNYNVCWLKHEKIDNMNLVAHEIAHSFGGQHSGISPDCQYKSRWDVLSGGGTRCGAVVDNTFGCLPPHLIAFTKDKLGLIPADRRFDALAGTTRLITLARLAQPPLNGYLMAKIPIAGTRSYTVEARMKTGYDESIPGDAVIIHDGDPDRRGCEAYVVDADGDDDPNDEGAMWLPGETFLDSPNQIMVSVLDATSSGYLVGISTAPRNPCYVDVSNMGAEDGTLANPFNSVLEGVAGVIPSGRLLIAPGNYRENLVIRKPCLLEHHGASGSVIIGE